MNAGRSFLATVLHRLSQPLTALRGSLELALLTEPSAEEYRVTLEESLELADRLVRLICSLRELAESGNPENVREPVSLGKMVQEVAQVVQPLAESRSLTMALESAGDLYVRANSARLQEAVLKLIGIAFQRSPERGTVRVSLRTSYGDACLDIADQGRALSPEELDRFFEPFYSSASPTAPEASDLEPAIAKGIVEAMSGTIQVENALDQGCCFRIRFRLPPADT